MPQTSKRPVVVAIDMGYGHLRAAISLADLLGVPLQRMEEPPLGDARDAKFWGRTRELYEALTRFSQLPAVSRPLGALVQAITAIPPPWPRRDRSGASAGTRWMERAARSGAGAQLARHLNETGAPLLATFYAAAILAELHGARNLNCVVTDSDVNRVWAPPEPRKSAIRYFAPTEHARRRLLSYGVLESNVRTTGFPLPDHLVGRDRSRLRTFLAARLARLAPREHLRARAIADLGALPPATRPPLVVFAVGGAGAQIPLAVQLVRGMADEVKSERLRLALVAGRREKAAHAFREALRDAGLDGHPGAVVLYDPDTFAYLRKFHDLLGEADALWSKPSELTFFAALGLPFVCAPPVGVHEERNRGWAEEQGALLRQHDPGTAGAWLREWVEDGTLARAAWSGYLHLPALGLYEIADALE
ncbi:MAG: hypothetical protein ACJ781_16650 [Myxococcales bacterium]